MCIRPLNRDKNSRYSKKGKFKPLVFYQPFVVFYAPSNEATNFITMTGTYSDKLHLGRKVVRIRELRGMKQETLAEKLGVSQQTVSKLENSETIEEERLKAIAEALQVTPDVIRHFNEDALFNNIQHNADTASGNLIVNYQFNPIDKIVELYERLLKSEQEKVALLQALLQRPEGEKG